RWTSMPDSSACEVGERRNASTSAVAPPRPVIMNGPLPTGCCAKPGEADAAAALRGTIDSVGDANAIGKTDHELSNATCTTPGDGTVTPASPAAAPDFSAS